MLSILPPYQLQVHKGLSFYSHNFFDPSASKWVNTGLGYFYSTVSTNQIISNRNSEVENMFYHIGEANVSSTFLNSISPEEDIRQHFLRVDNEIDNLYNMAKSYVKTDILNADIKTNFYTKTDKLPSDEEYQFDVITNYPDKETIDDKFYELDQVLLNSYYKKNNGGDHYTFHVIKDYDNPYTDTIDAKFYALDQALKTSYYKKNRDETSSGSEFEIMGSYNQNIHIDKYFHKVDLYLSNNSDLINDYLKTSNKTIEAQTIRIKQNTDIINDQETLIEDNQTAILNKILEVKKTAYANEKEISLNLEAIEPSQNTTKIFNTLAEQAKEEISLNTEVIEDNNELLNKTDKNNEADNNALYVMVTALTAPFIGLSLYYSSDTEENIDNEIEAF